MIIIIIVNIIIIIIITYSIITIIIILWLFIVLPFRIQLYIRFIAGWWLTYPSEKWWSSSVGMVIPFPIDGKS
jgi:hypothetical protein